MEGSTLIGVCSAFGPPPAVVPVLVGPMYALFAILPAIAVALGRLVWQLLGPKGLWRTAQMIWRQKIGVVVVAGACVGIFYAWPYLFPPTVVSAPPAEAGEWPYFRGNLARTGYQGGKDGDPVQGQKVWSYVYSKDISTVFCSPALVGNRLYTAMAFYGYWQDWGAICCLNPDTGGLIWAYRADYRAAFSSPVVKGKYLVVGEGLHFTTDARVFCFDVQKSEKDHKGAKLWEYRTKSHVESSPCIFDDKVVIGAGEDGVYCFRLEPDAKGNAQIVWHLDAKNYTDIETSPVFQDGKLYWGLGRFGGQAVVCIDGNTGQEYWRVPTPSPVVGSPAIANGKLYVGMGFGDYVLDSTRVASDLPPKLKGRGWDDQRIQEYLKTIKREGQVWCIDISKKDTPDANARVLWKFTAGQVVLATPAVDGNEVYFGSRDGKVYCVSADKGEMLRSYDCHEPVLASPAVGKDTVYVATLRGRICGLDKARFRLVWDVPLNLGNNEFCSSSPAVGRGHLYVGAPRYGLLCLGKPRTDEGAIWAGNLGGAGKGGWADESVIPDAGVYAWGFPMGEANAKGAGPLPPAAYLSGAFYVSASKGLTRLYCGKDLFTKPARQWTVPSDNPVSLSAAGTDKGVFFVDGKSGDAGRQLRCVDPNTGAVRWRRPVDKDATGEFVLTGGRLLIAEGTKGLTCLDVSDPSKAQEAWKADIGPTVGAPFVEEGLVLAAVGSPARLVGLDLATGRQEWDAALARPPATNPVMLMDRVWVGDEKGLSGTSRTRKDDVWFVPCGRVGGPLAGRGDRLACLAEGGELVLVNASIGEVAARLGKVPGGIPPILTDDTLLYLTKGAIQSYSLKTGQSAQWTKIDTDFLGNVITPMIVANSYVVFGTDDEGLVCVKPKK